MPGPAARQSRRLEAFLGGTERVLHRVAAWGFVVVGALLPFRRHTMARMQEILYGAALLLVLAAVARGLGGFASLRSKPVEQHRGVGGPFFRFGPLFPAVAAFVLTAAMAAAFSMSPSFSRHELWYQMGPFALTWLVGVNVLAGPQWRRRALIAFLGAGTAGALIGIIGYYSGELVKSGRAMGALYSYTKTALYLVLWLALLESLALGRGGASSRRRTAAALLALAGWWLLFLTASRIELIAAALGALALAAARKWRLAGVVLLLLAIAGASVAPLRARIVKSVRDLGDPDALLSRRPELWRTALAAAIENPWAGLGYGTDIFDQRAVRKVYPLHNYRDQPDPRHFYLQAACEGGLPHLAALLAVFAGFCVVVGRALRAAKKRGPPADGADALDRSLAAGALVGIAGMLLCGFITNFHETHNGLAAWYVLTLGAAAAMALRARGGGRNACEQP